MFEAAIAKSESQPDSQINTQLTEDTDDSLSAKLWRETQLIGSVASGAFKEGIKEFSEDPVSGGTKLAASVGIGALLGYSMRSKGLVKGIGTVAGAGFAGMFAGDVMLSTRWQKMYSNMGQAWQTDHNFAANQAAMELYGGHFLYNTGLMLGGGIAGFKAGGWSHGKIWGTAEKPGMFFKSESGQGAFNSGEAPFWASRYALEPVPVLGNRGLARALNGKGLRGFNSQGEIVDPFSTAKGILKPAEPANSLQDLPRVLAEQKIAQDAIAQGMKQRIGDLAARGNTGEASALELGKAIGEYQAHVKALTDGRVEIVPIEPVAKPAEVKKAPEAKAKPEARVETVKSPEQLAVEKAELAFKQAEAAVNEYHSKRQAERTARQDMRDAGRELEAIDKGKKSFESEAAKAEAIEQLTAKKAGAQARLAEIGRIQYFRPMQQIHEYAKAVEQVLATGRDTGSIASEAVPRLEAMLSKMQNGYKGARGKPDLPREKQMGMAEKRLDQISQHLDARLGEMNNAHSARNDRVLEIPVVKEALAKADAGGLQDDASIIFFENGRFVTNTNARGEFHPQYLDVARYKQGQGRIDRFQGHTEIDGYAVFGPMVRGGKTVTRTIRGQELQLKEVLETGGNVPADVKPGTSFGSLVSKYKPDVKTGEIKAPRKTKGTPKKESEG